MFEEVLCNDFVDVLSHLLSLGNKEKYQYTVRGNYTITYGNRFDLLITLVRRPSDVLSRKARVNKV